MVQDSSSRVVRDLIWLLSPNAVALRTLCRSQKAVVPWPEKPKLQFTPCGYVRWTWHFHFASTTIYWWHPHIVSTLVGLHLVLGKHEFDWASCWSVWWLGKSAQTSLAGQPVENTSRRSFSKSEQSENTWLEREHVEQIGRSFGWLCDASKAFPAGQQVDFIIAWSFEGIETSISPWPIQH